MNEPSKVTKVLISKIHGGRKQDSKFWQSEFSKKTTPDKHPKQTNLGKTIFYPLIALALCIIGYASYFTYNNFFSSPDVLTEIATIHSNSIAKSNFKNRHKNKSIYYSGNKKPKPS